MYELLELGKGIISIHLNAGFVQVTNIGGGLPRLLTHHHRLRVDETEGINDDLALDRLNRVHDNSNSAFIQLLKTLLGFI
jgi:hypothetical protein